MIDGRPIAWRPRDRTAALHRDRDRGELDAAYLWWALPLWLLVVGWLVFMTVTGRWHAAGVGTPGGAR